MTVDLSKAKPGDIAVLRDGTEAQIGSIAFDSSAQGFSVYLRTSVAGTLTGSGRCYQWCWYQNGKKCVFSEEEGNHIVEVRSKEESRSRAEASGPSSRLQTEGVEMKPGYWKTRGGSTAYVVGRRVMSGTVSWPWLGEVQYKDGSTSTVSWTNTGHDGDEDICSATDLIEYIGPNLPKPKKKVTHTCWVNLYDDGGKWICDSREEADERARMTWHTRVECREITWTVEVDAE